MRTTIRIEDELYRRAKAEAARRGQTVGELIADAVRAALRRPADRRTEIPPLPTFGEGGVMPGVDLGDSRALRDLMDEGRGVDALR